MPVTKWYKTYRWSNTIAELEVSFETERFVTVVHSDGSAHRDAKCAQSTRCFPTKQEAIDHLIQSHVMDVQVAMRNLQRADEDLRVVRELYG